LDCGDHGVGFVVIDLTKNPANEIKAFINRNGWTQAKCAKELNIDRRRLNGILVGGLRPTENELAKIEKFFADRGAR